MSSKSILRKKRELRNKVTALISGTAADTLSREGRIITDRILSSPEWEQAELILAYLPFGHEYDSAPLIRAALDSGKQAALPRLINRTRNTSLGRDMEFHLVENLEGPLEEHPYGILEPPVFYPKVNPKEFKRGKIMVIVPGIGFDRENFRLGRGGGYYDTYIARYGQHLILTAPAFFCQMIERIPSEPHDRAVDRVFYPISKDQVK